MPDAKPGFFQTLPGILTAGAGFLSATTGVMVALNQTGVIDFKQMTGSKPPAQTAPAEPQTAVAPPTGAAAGGGGTVAKPDSATKVADAGRRDEMAPASRTVQTDPVKPATEAPRVALETRRDDARTTSASAPSGEIKPAGVPTETRYVEPTTQTERRPATVPPPPVVTRPENQQPTEVPVRDTTVEVRRHEEVTPPASRVQPDPVRRAQEPPKPVIETKPQDRRVVPPPPAVGDGRAPTSQPEKPVSDPRKQPETRPATVPPPVTEKVPPAAPDKAPTKEPEGPKRAATGKSPERVPTSPSPTEDEAKKEKLRRLLPDRATPGDKANEEPKQDGRRRLGDNDAKEPRRAALDDSRKKAEPGANPSAASGHSPLDLTGLKLTVPAGWTTEEVERSPTGPVAMLKIPSLDGKDGDGMVRITHYMGAKGKDMEDRQIDRWIGQVAKPNGSPMTRSDAKVATTQMGSIRLTTVELAGTIKLAARDPGQPGQRMLAAIVDHPKGAHLVVITGPARSMDQWDSTIDAFLRSAKAE